MLQEDERLDQLKSRNFTALGIGGKLALKILQYEEDEQWSGGDGKV